MLLYRYIKYKLLCMIITLNKMYCLFLDNFQENVYKYNITFEINHDLYFIEYNYIRVVHCFIFNYLKLILTA